MALAGHESWYYDCPGARGAANPDPEQIVEVPLLERVRELALQSRDEHGGDLAWLDSLAANVVESASSNEAGADALNAQFLDDVQTLDRLAEVYGLRPSFRAYAQVNLFTIRFDLTWLVVTVRP